MGIFSSSKSSYNHSPQYSKSSSSCRIPANPQTRIAPKMSYEQLKRKILYLEDEIHKLEGQLDASDLRSRMWWTDIENYYNGMKKDSEEFQRKVDQRQVRFRNAMRKAQDRERAIRKYEEGT
ncbi:uncharacterized protein EAE97_005140 [Botrytis byssoidea]|uniref:Uncharacterized protein n=1 Tax=Botrytis byssoidea TaxID=139641 RepID=A0A9P5M7E9_9HELO|nr:uncharacterized protein EAE97_005140 [Botrytis byssoidea]KAF7946102.1 hypothetical protein EAE97_005140 [Botrytis byssoidea]